MISNSVTWYYSYEWTLNHKEEQLNEFLFAIHLKKNFHIDPLLYFHLFLSESMHFSVKALMKVALFSEKFRHCNESYFCGVLFGQVFLCKKIREYAVISKLWEKLSLEEIWTKTLK